MRSFGVSLKSIVPPMALRAVTFGPSRTFQFERYGLSNVVWGNVVPFVAVPPPRHVYLHVPFCARRCSYCDFSIAVRRAVPVDEYLTALESELTLRFPARGQSPGSESGVRVRGQSPDSDPDWAERNTSEVDTIYLGGGTPSRLGGAGVARALALVRERFPLAPGAEDYRLRHTGAADDGQCEVRVSCVVT